MFSISLMLFQFLSENPGCFLPCAFHICALIFDGNIFHLLLLHGTQLFLAVRSLDLQIFLEDRYLLGNWVTVQSLDLLSLAVKCFPFSDPVFS